MATYQARDRASTWVTFLNGVLSGPGAAIQWDAVVNGSVVGQQTLTNDTIIQLTDGRFTKVKWFRVISPDTQPPPPPPPPPPLPITTTRYRLEWDEDNTGLVTGLKFYRNGVQAEL